MPKIADILTLERTRPQASDLNLVHIYKTGSFYTAYDYSAWLMAVISYNDQVRMQSRDRKPLTVTRIKLATDDRTFCRVGFPIKSIEKFAPNRTDFNAEDDAHITFRVPLPEPKDGTEVTFDRLQKAVDEWTETFKIKPPKEEQSDQPASKPSTKPSTEIPATVATPTPGTGTGLIQQIMAYPLSERTPTENIAFITSLKQQIAALL